MSQQHTVEGLLDAIRNAASLEELQCLAGPSDAEKQVADNRLAQMEAIALKCEFESLTPSHQAMQARARYDEVAEVQAGYERRYC
ncbi:hypothetical protein [Alicycliphilus denitrificans]|uniref:hypothetical protein n=1 Tax=Alicycliphilus denitrificans TaxID=179636 RepID=UPI0001D9E93C|nr:hypothetical protein [Alicycliphilus denitrificans]ADV02189.1 hypothetical protein Alide_4587 [Alicycliphilus denitrificans BC]